jgi:hypothetical protein
MMLMTNFRLALVRANSGLTKFQKEEEDLLCRVNLVFANGPVLLAAKNRYVKTMNVLMTADFSIFSGCRLLESLVPQDLD